MIPGTEILMSLVQAITAESKPQQKAIMLHGEKCLHSIDRFSSCDICIKECPVEALTLGDPIILDQGKCVGCGLCLHVCPVDAFRGNDGVTDLIKHVSHIEKQSICELACNHNSNLEFGPSQSDLVMVKNGCLASLGPSVYMSLFALGVRKIIVRLDSCSSCESGRAFGKIEKYIHRAASLLIAQDKTSWPILIVVNHEDDWPERSIPIYNARTSLYSRRDFLTPLSRLKVPQTTVSFLSLDGTEKRKKRPPRERRRLIKALGMLPSIDKQNLIPALLTKLAFTNIKVGAVCNACGVCTRSCPTSSLKLNILDDDTYQLIFSLADCIACGICLEFCQCGALDFDILSSLSEILSADPIILSSGSLNRCSRCGSRFSGKGELCSICSNSAIFDKEIQQKILTL